MAKLRKVVALVLLKALRKTSNGGIEALRKKAVGVLGHATHCNGLAVKIAKLLALIRKDIKVHDL